MNSFTTQRLVAACERCGLENSPAARFCNQCGHTLDHAAAAADAPNSERAPTSTLADPLIGMVIADRYRILRPLGRGGMGVVYKVEHVRIGKVMALKLLTGELSSDGELIARFKREAQMVSKLSHPNTVQVFDFGTSDGLTYLAMEYLDGRDLGRVIEDAERLDPVRVAKLTIQICSSLAEAHGKGMIHRDLKPENLVLLETPNQDELIKVLDFGLAKLRESSELMEVTTRGAIVGTPYYMSPEQVRGEAVDHRSDLYALGALMYKALTGRPVFDAATPVGVLTRHLTDGAEPPSLRFPEFAIPEGLSRIVMRLLDKDPGRRFQSVGELQAALIAELESLGVNSGVVFLDSSRVRELQTPDLAAATRNEIERYERKLRRRGQAVWVVLGVLVVGAAIGGYKLYERATFVAEFSGAESEPNDQASSATMVPFSSEVRGHLGKRLDATTADRDFFRVDVPDSTVSLKLSALPNLAHCAALFRVGLDQPLGKYCGGRPGQGVEVSQLRLEPGSYLLMVTQDRDAYGDASVPPLIENISDQYLLRLGAAELNGSAEVEPNDQANGANQLTQGQAIEGRLNWMRDVDVFCAESDQSYAFEISELSSRSRVSALQATPIGGPGDGIPKLVFPASHALPVGDHGSLSPYVTPAATGKTCVTLTLAVDPQSPLPHPRVAPAGTEAYRVRLITAAPEPAPSASSKPRPRAAPMAQPKPAPPASAAAPAPAASSAPRGAAPAASTPAARTPAAPTPAASTP